MININDVNSGHQVVDEKEKSNLNLQSKVDSNNKGQQESQVDILIKLCKGVVFYHDDSGNTYCVVEINGGTDLIRLKSEKFKSWLIKIFYKKTGKALGIDAINQALSFFQMMALCEGEKRNFSKRCTKLDGKLFYDLSNNLMQVIEITKDDWTVPERSPTLFIKTNNMKEQVFPVRNEDLSIIDKHFTLKNKEDAILLKVVLVAMFIPDISHPISVIYGEKGSSKTTTMRKQRSIVDPVTSDIVSMPTSVENLAIILNNNYMACFDNIDSISQEKSDILCMSATGGYYSKRALYTNDDEVILNFKAPVCLNGINVVATKADLLDRSILFELDRIPQHERKDEATIWAEFEADKPKILGAIFTTLSKAMAIYENLELNKLGRMADFSKWGYAIAEAAGIGGENFLNAYISNQNRANEEAVESNPVALAVIKLMTRYEEWNGSMSQLLMELQGIAESECIDIRNRLWAKEPNVLSRRLRELKSNLESVDIRYNIRHLSKAKYITLVKGNVSFEEEEEVDDGFEDLFTEGEGTII